MAAAAAKAAAASPPAPAKSTTQLAATPADAAQNAGQSVVGNASPAVLAGSPHVAPHDATEKYEATAAVAQTQEEKDAAIEELTQSFANQV